MYGLESILIGGLLNFFDADTINAFFRDPKTTAVIVGSLIAVSGALLGTFLLLRGLSLTSDAISHTVLLGIVVAFMVMVGVFNLEPTVSSPWLIIGAAGAGVATVVLTELIYRSGLVKQDAALGLAFPLLFAVAIILVSRFVDDVHLDEDAVMVGEIGVAWANTTSHCIDNCTTITIMEDDPQAQLTRQCTNCRDLGISPRDEGAEFREICTNCGTYSPGQAWQAGLIDDEPTLVFWPQSVTVMALMALLTVGFVTLFYKELKLAAFDEALAKALGFRPGVLHYALMVLVSLVAVGAFDAVGSILVIAFFIIPPAAAYLLTDRLALMLLFSALIGSAGAFFGYELARGDFILISTQTGPLSFVVGDAVAWINNTFGLELQTGGISFAVEDVIAWINNTFGLELIEEWDSSISASMVLMLFAYFLLAWVLSPKYGLIATLVRRANQRRRFANQVVLGHIYNHQHADDAVTELSADSFYTHFKWSRVRMALVMAWLRALNLVHIERNLVTLTARGETQVRAFHQRNLATDVDGA